MKRVGLPMLAVFFLLAAWVAVPGSAFAANTKTVSGTFRFGNAQSVLTLVNKQRSSYGRSSLVMTKELTEVAMMRAAELAVKFSHTRPNGQSYPSVVPRNYTCAENIANGQTTPSVVMSDWMNSPGHRSNILDPDFSYIGIGCFQCGSQYYWVQVFSDSPGSPATKESRTGDRSATVKVALDTNSSSSATISTSSSGGSSSGGSSSSYCTISFNANGGRGSMAKQKVTPGVQFTLRKNAFTRSGYVFIGWAQSKNGPVVVGNQGTGTAGNAGSLTLYAKWAKKNYKVKFYANGGKGKMAVEKFTYGKAKKLTANKFKRKGYRFVGWAKSTALAKKGKVAYKNKKKVKNLIKTGKTVKLYAVWKKK